MLKTKPLNALLSQSLSEHVSSALLFTPAGNLLATANAPSSSHSRKSRVHAALAANIWQTYTAVAARGAIESSLPPSSAAATAYEGQDQNQDQTAFFSPSTAGAQPKDTLDCVTVELTEYNIHVQAVKPKLLLALIGASGTAGSLGVLQLAARTLVEYLKEELGDFEPPDGV